MNMEQIADLRQKLAKAWEQDDKRVAQKISKQVDRLTIWAWKKENAETYRTESA